MDLLCQARSPAVAPGTTADLSGPTSLQTSTGQALSSPSRTTSNPDKHFPMKGGKEEEYRAKEMVLNLVLCLLLHKNWAGDPVYILQTAEVPPPIHRGLMLFVSTPNEWVFSQAAFSPNSKCWQVS